MGDHKMKALNDYTVRIAKSVLVQASSPSEAFKKAARHGIEEWSTDGYTAECEQCDDVFFHDVDGGEEEHDCEVLKVMQDGE